MILGTIPIRVCVECLWIQESLVVDQRVVFGLGSGGQLIPFGVPMNGMSLGHGCHALLGLQLLEFCQDVFP